MTIDLREARVLVTGGAGFVGSTIVDLLVERGAREIVVLDNFERGRPTNLRRAVDHGHVTVIDGDIRNASLLAEATAGVDVTFHEAAIRITQCADEPRLALEVLVDGTFNVVEAAQKAGVKKIVAASSASVYGLAGAFPTREDHHPYANRTLYGAAKLFTEGLLRSYHDTHGLDYVALRYFNVYGPRMDIHGAYTEVLVRWIERISSGRPPLILGDGRQTMDFIHVSDVARANILAAESDVADEVINIASGVETSLDDLARSLLTVMDADLEPEYGLARTVNAVARRLGDTTKARRLLGFAPEVGLEEGLARLVAWWRTAREPTPA